MSFFRIAVVLIYVSLTSACATIVKGTTQTIPVSSNPSGADVVVDGSVLGQTPVDLELKRKTNHLLTIQMDGYQPQTIPITKNVGGAVFGNILAGGLIGWGVDATSGAQYNLSPKTIFMTLEPGDGNGDPNEIRARGQTFMSKLEELDKLAEDKRISEDEYKTMRKSLFHEYYPDMEYSDPDEPDS